MMAVPTTARAMVAATATNLSPELARVAIKEPIASRVVDELRGEKAGGQGAPRAAHAMDPTTSSESS